jgi:HAMP domain-containing protein
VESFFYAVLGICGLLLGLQALFSAMRIRKQDRATQSQQTDQKPPKTGSVSQVNGRKPPEPWIPYMQSLSGRMVATFTCIVAMLGLVTIALVYFTVKSSLRYHAIERARVTAVNVSDSAAGYILKKNAKGLRELLQKRTNRSEVAYILVRNNLNKTYAHTFDVLPAELENTSSAVGDQGERSLRLGGVPVIEVGVPILEGRSGTVRIGIWQKEIDREISRAITPLIKALFLVVLGGIVLSMYLAWKINRPIVRLMRSAQKISDGDLDAPSFGTADKTEFGELARALERMRSSIKAALARLSEQQHS